jgi:hypothetical protein
VAGHAGNFFTAAIGRQSAKGTPQTTPKFKLRVTGDIVDPTVQILDLPETDSSIQRSRAIKVGELIEGTLSGFVRADEYGFLAYLHMGAVAVAGVNPYTHTITAATQLPYATIYNAFDSTALVSRMADCRIPTLSVAGGSGQALTYSAGVMGLIGLEGETDPVLAPSAFEPLVYPHVTVSYNSATTDIVEAFTLASERAAQVIQGDTGMTASDSVTGRWGVTGTLRVLFETDAIWRDYLTDSTVGTAHSQAINTVPLNIVASRSATADEVSWDINAAEIRNVSLVPDPSGNPLFYDIEWSAKPDATIANTLEIVAKNTTATYTA